ncbi:hypothetical protein BGZ61DRAFT_572118 [Ilyonectria robusta]|uniref:uncharacterized protein n=1 Tax=Ilyonectria robusta TaxID=1079257 RepID=UPI001E8CE4FA|nr:uncharacterized protein BGZ61DRAFT_572118 [Ilyonectria robusta]KAH8721913.1 hypothetical protein BGZ61DRAFT_572118 [Ilyonectria robusta]
MFFLQPHICLSAYVRRVAGTGPPLEPQGLDAYLLRAGRACSWIVVHGSHGWIQFSVFSVLSAHCSAFLHCGLPGPQRRRHWAIGPWVGGPFSVGWDPAGACLGPLALFGPFWHVGVMRARIQKRLAPPLIAHQQPSVSDRTCYSEARCAYCKSPSR